MTEFVICVSDSSYRATRNLPFGNLARHDVHDVISSQIATVCRYLQPGATYRSSQSNSCSGTYKQPSDEEIALFAYQPVTRVQPVHLHVGPPTGRPSGYGFGRIGGHVTSVPRREQSAVHLEAPLHLRSRKAAVSAQPTRIVINNVVIKDDGDQHGTGHHGNGHHGYGVRVGEGSFDEIDRRYIGKFQFQPTQFDSTPVHAGPSSALPTSVRISVARPREIVTAHTAGTSIPARGRYYTVPHTQRLQGSLTAVPDTATAKRYGTPTTDFSHGFVTRSGTPATISSHGYGTPTTVTIHEPVKRHVVVSHPPTSSRHATPYSGQASGRYNRRLAAPSFGQRAVLSQATIKTTDGYRVDHIVPRELLSKLPSHDITTRRYDAVSQPTSTVEHVVSPHRVISYAQKPVHDRVVASTRVAQTEHQRQTNTGREDLRRGGVGGFGGSLGQLALVSAAIQYGLQHPTKLPSFEPEPLTELNVGTTFKSHFY